MSMLLGELARCQNFLAQSQLSRSGAYFLGMISPHLMVLLNARAAAATIYQVIDRVRPSHQLKFEIRAK